MIGHLKHHARFYLALVAATLAWIATAQVRPEIALVVAGDVLFATYLAGGVVLAAWLTPDRLRQRASEADEGAVLIIALVICAIGFSVVSLVQLLRDKVDPDPSHMTLALLSLPLSWLTLHTLALFHYAHRYYADADPSSARRDARGLGFPGATDDAGFEPGIWDFAYFAFTVGTTAQTSDVTVETTGFRRAVLLHGMASFLFNTVLVAVAVNLAIGG